MVVGLVAVGDEQIFVDRAGAGAPVLLIHSLGTGAWLWQAQVRRWAGMFDVIAVEARGHGQSSCVGGWGVREVAADFLGVLQALAVGPVRVVAISMGGPIAAHMVDLAPDMVERLVIADSFATQGDAGAARAASIEAAILGGSMAAYGSAYATETLVEDGDPSLVEALAASIGGMRAEDYIAAAKAVFTADVVGLLGRVRVPTRVVVGSRDQRTPLRLSEQIVGLVPGAELRVIEGARHLSNLDREEGFHAAIDDFLGA